MHRRRARPCSEEQIEQIALSVSELGFTNPILTLEMRKSMAALRALSPGVDHEPQTVEDRSGFAQTLLALARTLDSHVERSDAEVLPSILRGLSHH